MSLSNNEQYDVADVEDIAMIGGLLLQQEGVETTSSTAVPQQPLTVDYSTQQGLWNTNNTAPLQLPTTTTTNTAAAMAASYMQQQQQQSRLSLPKTSHKGKRVSRKRSYPETVSVSSSEKERLRQDRNQREQQRSHKISGQIDALKEILQQASIPCKPDRYSTLQHTALYLKQLQQRSQLLDQEHDKLKETMERTQELVESGGSIMDESVNSTPTNDTDDDTAFVTTLDFHSIFAQTPVALALTRVDGRFLDCNEAWQELSGFTRAELLPMDEKDATLKQNLSVFNVFGSHDMRRVFDAMSDMLQSIDKECWTGSVALGREPGTTVCLIVRLVRNETTDLPRFFSCSLLPREDDASASNDKQKQSQ